jgi:hypothetical protein
MEIVDDPGASRYHLLTALRVVVLMDNLNARREVEAGTQELEQRREQVAAVRAALATAEGRAALAALSQTLAAPKGLPAPPSQDATDPPS